MSCYLCGGLVERDLLVYLLTHGETCMHVTPHMEVACCILCMIWQIRTIQYDTIKLQNQKQNTNNTLPYQGAPLPEAASLSEAVVLVSVVHDATNSNTPQVGAYIIR